MTTTITPAMEQAVADMPPALQEKARNCALDLVQLLQGEVDLHGEWAASLPAVAACSEFVYLSCKRNPGMMTELMNSGDLVRVYDDGELLQRVQSALEGVEDEATLQQQLRRIRRREMVRLAWRDLAGWAELHEVLALASELADVLVDAALSHLHRWSADKDGNPVGVESGQPVELVVLGLGKLGGRELNFSSDIDLIFFYEEEGDTRDGRRSITNHEYFIRLAKKLIKVLGETTADGFVFRVDMRLRPNGNAGPLALSFDAAELYYQVHGRDWERYAMIKARVIAGDRQAGDRLLTMLRPFIFRRYLDYGAIDSIRQLKLSINQELLRKGAENDIKRGAGGIREIEFIGQAHQLIRGGRQKALQAKEILTVLQHLYEENYITPREATELSLAYEFLRRTENRQQEYQDQQTHALPLDEDGRTRLAFTMGYADWDSFNQRLRRHMSRVHGYFEQLFVSPQGEDNADAESGGLLGVWVGNVDDESAILLLAKNGYGDDAAEALHLIRGLHQGSAYTTFSSQGRQRMDRLMPLLLAAAGLSLQPKTTLSRLVKLLEAIGRRSVYLALLVENPIALSQLVKLCSASPWIADWIAQHPLLLDELLNPVDAYRPQDRSQLAAELDRMLEQVDSDDLERQMEILREFCNRHVLHVAAADVGPGLPPEQVGALLTMIAEVLIEASARLAFEALAQKHGTPRCGDHACGFLVVGYGKLGSHELGYASDVDMIFLHEEASSSAMTEGPRSVPHETFFARVGQRLIHILTTRMMGGILYEVDMRLRPSGQSGPLVTHLAAFEKYQVERAWTWEHQALVRSRPVAGDPALAEAYLGVRRKILCQSRDPQKLAAEVVEMRQKMLDARPAHEASQFDVKLDPGGIVDIEFMVQYWVLRWAHESPVLIEHTDNVAILGALAETGHVKQEWAELLTGAYHRYLSTAYRLKLTQAGAFVSLASEDGLQGLPQQVQNIWNEIFRDVDTGDAK